MKELTPKQLQAAALLASGETITATAEKTVAARVTLYDWLNNDDVFIAHLNGLKREIVDAGRAAIQSSCNLAINTIISIMEKSDNDAVRLNAAKEILSMSGINTALAIGSDSPANLKKERDKRAMWAAMDL